MIYEDGFEGEGFIDVDQFYKTPGQKLTSSGNLFQDSANRLLIDAIEEGLTTIDWYSTREALLAEMDFAVILAGGGANRQIRSPFPKCNGANRKGQGLKI